MASILSASSSMASRAMDALMRVGSGMGHTLPHGGARYEHGDRLFVSENDERADLLFPEIGKTQAWSAWVFGGGSEDVGAVAADEVGLGCGVELLRLVQRDEVDRARLGEPRAGDERHVLLRELDVPDHAVPQVRDRQDELGGLLGLGSHDAFGGVELAVVSRDGLLDLALVGDLSLDLRRVVG